MRDSRTIQAEIETLESRIKNLHEKINPLRKELNEALLAESKGADHEWLGKKVKQLVVGRGYRNKTKTRRGTLQLYDPDKQRHYRELYRPTPGDLIVVTDSGQTAYCFYTPEQLDRIAGYRGHREQNWELDE